MIGAGIFVAAVKSRRFCERIGVPAKKSFCVDSPSSAAASPEFGLIPLKG
jgi:hypothetical protein